jgi:hypothetical protein
VKIHVEIEGLTPLLMNRFTEDSEVKLTSGTSANYRGNRGSPREQAEPKAYMDDKGYLFVPGSVVFATLIAAGVFHKLGKSKVTTMKTSLIPAGLIVEELVCPLGTKDWEVDSRSVVIPSTGGRIMCHRPRIDKWSIKFTLDVDDTMFNPGLVRAIVDDAGKKVGFCDYRPARKGPFGRFIVKKWQIEKDKLSKAA